MLISIITPTYNRASTLHRSYESLSRQEYRNFEWIVVDDGSKDDTKEIVEKWQQQAWFKITYIAKANGGKPSAVNLGISLAEGETCTILDSDDAVAENGLKYLADAYLSIDPVLRSEYWCVVGLVEDSVTRQIIGSKFSDDRLTMTGGEFQFVYKIRGDKWSLMRTEIIKKHPYPEGEGYKFIPESYIWARLGRLYKYLCINEVVETYYLPEGAAVTNLSGKANAITNASGLVMPDADVLNYDLHYWFNESPVFFIKRAIQFTRYSLHSSSFRHQIGQLTSRKGKILAILSLPIGYMLAISDKLWYKYHYLPAKAKLNLQTIS